MKNIVLGHKAERDELLRGKYVPREGIQNARNSMQNNLIKVIIGPRRAGKSVFAIQITLITEQLEVTEKIFFGAQNPIFGKIRKRKNP